MKLLFILLSVVCAISTIEAKSPTLYARIQRDGTESTVFDVIQTIDPKTGLASDIVTSFLSFGQYAGFTFFGLSDISADGVMCYTPSAQITCVDLKAKTPLPTLIPGKLAADVNYDSKKDRFLITSLDATTPMLLSWKYGSDNPEIWTQLGTVQLSYGFGTLDAENQMFYWISIFNPDDTTYLYYLSYTSVDQPNQPTYSVQFQLANPTSYTVKELSYDHIHNKLYLFSVVNNIFTILTVDPNTGNVETTATNVNVLSEFVYSIAYDPNTQLVYFYRAKAQQIYTVDVTTGAVVNIASTPADLVNLNLCYEC